MEIYIFLLVSVTSIFIYPEVSGRTRHYNFPIEQSNVGGGVLFVDTVYYNLPAWEVGEGYYKEWKNRRNHHEYLRSWDPNSVWFHDSTQKITTARTPSSPPSRQLATTALSSSIDDCIKTCPATSEYNPVCGTNSVTYTNSGRLECARFCGVDVDVHRTSPCPMVSKIMDEPLTTSASTLTVAEIQRQCIAACPTTSEYNPVCGTNNVTYQNVGRLECAKTCGIDVQLARQAPCPPPKTILDESTKNIIVGTSDSPKNVIPQDIFDNIFNPSVTNSNESFIDIRVKDQ